LSRNRDEVLAHFSLPLSIFIHNFAGELNPDVIIFGVLTTLYLHSNGLHFGIGGLNDYWASTLPLRSIAFMVNSTVSNRLDTVPMAELPVGEVLGLIKLYFCSISRVAERRCICGRLFEVIHDFNKLSDSFDCSLQFEKGVVVDLSFNLAFFVLLICFCLALF